MKLNRGGGVAYHTLSNFIRTLKTPKKIVRKFKRIDRDNHRSGNGHCGGDSAPKVSIGLPQKREFREYQYDRRRRNYY